MPHRLQLAAIDRFARLERRQRLLLALERRIGVVGAFDVGAEKAGKEHGAPAGLKDGVIYAQSWP